MGDFMKPLFQLLEVVINFWWLWAIFFILGTWKFIDLIIILLHHIK